MSLSEFLHMGGYGVYVWSSYTVALIVLLVNVLNPYFRQKRLIRELARKARLRSRI